MKALYKKNIFYKIWLKTKIMFLTNLLYIINKKEEKIFKNLKDEFFSIYQGFKKYDISKYLIAAWDKNIIDLENLILTNLNFNFLNNPIIQKTMFVNCSSWIDVELKYLKQRINDKKLKYLLRENAVGAPPISNYKYLTSGNSIHMLYHLERFIDSTKCNLNKINSVVEWGGGYGNFARIFFKLIRGCTYVMIDLPLFSVLQWIYLKVAVGRDKVNIIKSVDDKIVKNRINILPVCFLDYFNIDCDLFISTWALSESNAYSQQCVREKGWLESNHLLLGYQSKSKKFPFAEEIMRYVHTKDDNIIFEDIDFLPGNKYIFK